MSRVSMPYDIKSADSVLGKFMDMAFQCQYEEIFARAVTLKHGPFFVVKKDGNQRMYFNCMICNKDLNNIRSLTEHAMSGNHNKNKDSQLEKKTFLMKKFTTTGWDPNTLQYRICHEESPPLVGLQRVESYQYEKGRLYYKCILCGSHGNADSMYRHLKGNRHTDKYIKTRILLKTSTISDKERTLLRERINAKENFTVDYIRNIEGKEFYPFRWEEEKGTRTTGTGDQEEFCDKDRRLHKEECKKEIKKELIEDYKKEEEETDLRDALLQTEPTETIEPVVKVDKGIQSYSFGFLNNILLKFNIIIQAHLIKETDLHSLADLRVALNIMRYALHLLFHVHNREEVLNQRHVIKSCLGYLMKKLIPHFETRYGELEL